MRYVSIFIFLAVSNLGFGQTLKFRYADLSYPLGGFSSKSTVRIDYGDSAFGWFKKAETLEDSLGNVIKFKSPVDALNWVSDKGWELVQSYKDITDYGWGSKLETIHFIIRRREE